MDADETKAEWFNAFRNILLFSPCQSAQIRDQSLLQHAALHLVAVSAHGVSAHS
jgi:hypothetical protein